MAYRKISMNRRPVGRRANRPGKYAKKAATSWSNAARGFQRLFRGHLGRRRAFARKQVVGITHMGMRHRLPKSQLLKARENIYKASWRGHRNRYSKRLRGRGSKSTSRGIYSK